MQKQSFYIVARSFVTEDMDGVDLAFDKGEKLYAESFDTIVREHGGTEKLPPHVARHPDWYFVREGEFNPQRPSVNQTEYVLELARGYDGLKVGQLYEIAVKEGFGPLNRPIPYSGFTRAMTDAVASGKVEMRKDGEVVKGVGHNVHGSSYHAVKRNATKNGDGLFYESASSNSDRKLKESSYFVTPKHTAHLAELTASLEEAYKKASYDPGEVLNTLDDERLAEARAYLLKARDAYKEAVASVLSELRRVARRDRDDEFLAELDEHEDAFADKLARQALSA